MLLEQEAECRSWQLVVCSTLTSEGAEPVRDSCQVIESSEPLGLPERVTLNVNRLARFI